MSDRPTLSALVTLIALLGPLAPRAIAGEVDRQRTETPPGIETEEATESAERPTGGQPGPGAVPERAAAPPPATDELETGAATAVTGAIQGKEGVRIQTLCTHCNSANIQLGGLSRDLVPITRDGFPVVGGLQTSLILSILPGDTIASAEVVKGPGDAAQSNAAAGGEIRLTDARASELPRFDFFAEAGSFDQRRATARVAGSLASWASGSIAFGTAEADTVDDDEDGFVDVPAVERDFADANLRLSPTSNHDVTAGVSIIDETNPRGRGSFDAVAFVTEGVDSWTREDMEFERGEVRAGWEWRAPSGGELAVRALGATRDQEVTSQLTALTDSFIPGADTLISRFDINEENLWGSVSFDQPIGLSWRIDGGVEGSSQDVDAANREPLTIIGGGEAVEQTARETVDLLSVYVNAHWTPSPKWDFGFGLRRDQADFTTELSTEPDTLKRSEVEISPRLSVRFYPSRAWTLRLIAGDTFRPPTPILAEVCCGQRYQTSENVVSERGRTVAVEAAYVPTPRLRVGAYLARTEFDDHLVRVVGFSQVFIQTYAWANVPEATADRAELAVRWSPLKPLNVDVSFGWLSFENDRDEPVDVFVVPPSFSAAIVNPVRLVDIPYVAQRSGSFSASWTFGNSTVLAAQAGFTGPILIQQFTRLPTNSELDTESLRETPEFWLVNLAAQVPLHRRLELFLAVNNVGDEIQNDLGDPRTDYNWGPLAGRSWQAGLKVSVGR